MFQLFQYKEDEKNEDEEEMIVEGEEGEEEVEEEEETEKEIAARKMLERERQRVLFEIPLDLSTTFINIEQAQIFLQPCTSVVKHNFGQVDNHFVQDFQVLIYQRGHQMARIFQFRVYWMPKKHKYEPIPYNVSASLVGLRILVLRPNDSKEKIGFYPLFNEYMEIQGTQIIFKKKIIINIPNFERDEWIFSNEVAMAGYKIYYNQEDLEEDCLLLQANLAEVLNCREEFS